MTEHVDPERLRPAICDPDAHRQFAALAEAQGHRVYEKFVGGYVDYEWHKSRPLFLALPTGVADKRTLEFGCHIGASAIVLAALGAKVTAIDVSLSDLSLAELNARRYGVSEQIHFEHVDDTRRLPFADGSFDLITCNSVLEYVRTLELPDVLKELDRVLAARGVLMILGTSNRWWPKDVHTGRWLVNYLPNAWRQQRSRSVSPLLIKRTLQGYEDIALGAMGEALLEAKARAGASARKTRAAAYLQNLLRPLDLSVGMLAHSFMLILQKP